MKSAIFSFFISCILYILNVFQSQWGQSSRLEFLFLTIWDSDHPDRFFKSFIQSFVTLSPDAVACPQVGTARAAEQDQRRLLGYLGRKAQVEEKVPDSMDEANAVNLPHSGLQIKRKESMHIRTPTSVKTETASKRHKIAFTTAKSVMTDAPQNEEAEEMAVTLIDSGLSEFALHYLNHEARRGKDGLNEFEKAMRCAVRRQLMFEGRKNKVCCLPCCRNSIAPAYIQLQFQCLPK